jgi:hypothetical protein
MGAPDGNSAFHIAGELFWEMDTGYSNPRENHDCRTSAAKEGSGKKTHSVSLSGDFARRISLSPLPRGGRDSSLRSE